MKYITGILIFFGIGCGTIGKNFTPSGGYWSGDTLTAIVKQYKKCDSLFVKNKSITLTIFIPYSDSLRFKLLYSTTKTVHVGSKNNTTEMVFKIRDTSWSPLKKRSYIGYGPH